MRKTRFFQKNAYIAVDFLEKKVEVVKMKTAPKNPDDFALILENAEGEKNRSILKIQQLTTPTLYWKNWKYLLMPSKTISLLLFPLKTEPMPWS